MVDIEPEPPGNLNCSAGGDGESPRRRRSLSVASAQPSVETVVVKAKRAASTLWTLLHAKNCVLANVCPHLGCREAKLLHLHLKTCPAGEGFICPASYHGCNQARMLLAHYRRCRNMRARQVGQLPTNRRDPQQEQPVCLVCSLMARQARSSLEKPSTTSFSSSLNLSSSSSALLRPYSSTTVKKTNRRAVSSFAINEDDVGSPTHPSSETKMPPPPPRTISTHQGPSSSSSSPQCELMKPGIEPLSPNTKTNASSLLEPVGRHSVEQESSLLSLGIDPTENSASSPHRSIQDGQETQQLEESQESETSVRSYRRRSASVGDTTLLFASPSMDPACETIDEEPSEFQYNTSTFNFDGGSYNY